MNQEAADSMRLADAPMTSIYKQAMNSGDAQQKRLLLLAQRQWIKYKEAHCKAVANDYDKGSMQAMIFCNCITELTKERTQKIKRYLQEGGLY